MSQAAELLDVMRSTLQVHRELLSLEEDKEQILLRQDVAGLERCTREESELVQQLLRLEREREEWLRQWQEQMGASEGSPPTLSRIAEQLPEQERQALEELQQELRQVLQRLQRLNENNRLLLENSLAYVRYNLGLIASLEDAGIYTPGEAAGSPPGRERSWLDKKV